MASFGPSQRERMIGKKYASKNGDGSITRRKQVLGLGKDKPEPPQAAITINVFIPKDEYDCRLKRLQTFNASSDDLLAPLGDPECFRVPQGALLFAYANDSMLSRSTGTLANGPMAPNVVSDIKCFCTVNGLPKNTQLRFIGWNATNIDTPDFHRTDLAAVQVAGSCTVINTGKDFIPVKSQVFFSEEPYVLYDKGQKIPGIKEADWPNGDDRQNRSPVVFKPALFAENFSNTPTMLMIKTQEIRKKVIQESNGEKDRTEFNSTLLIPVIASIIEKHSANYPSTSFLKEYLWADFFELVLFGCTPLSLVKNAAFSKIVLEKIVNRFRKERDTYTKEALGNSKSSQGPLFEIFDRNSIKDAEAMEVCTNYMVQILKIKEFLYAAIKEWRFCHHIGESQQSSEVGSPFLLIMKHGTPQ